jgi:hypothetical protein
MNQEVRAGSLQGFRSIDDDPGSFRVRTDATHFKLDQDITPYLKHAAESREKQWEYRHSLHKSHWRPAFTLPDIVAIDILTKYGLDVHHPAFNSNPANGKRLLAIIKSDYPNLLMSHKV